MATADANRATQATQMNQSSSRSHLILKVTVTQENESWPTTLKGTLMLVDLAGSENSAKSGTLTNDSRLREGGNINKSLSTLGRVVKLLVSSKPSDQHIPYRDSVLTRILEQSLNGNSKAAFIMTINPARQH